jgi:hypothetical protein
MVNFTIDQIRALVSRRILFSSLVFSPLLFSSLYLYFFLVILLHGFGTRQGARNNYKNRAQGYVKKIRDKKKKKKGCWGHIYFLALIFLFCVGKRASC